jgi:hypothetical protein
MRYRDKLVLVGKEDLIGIRKVACDGREGVSAQGVHTPLRAARALPVAQPVAHPGRVEKTRKCIDASTARMAAVAITIMKDLTNIFSRNLGR